MAFCPVGMTPNCVLRVSSCRMNSIPWNLDWSIQTDIYHEASLAGYQWPRIGARQKPNTRIAKSIFLKEWIFCKWTLDKWSLIGAQIYWRHNLGYMTPYEYERFPPHNCFLISGCSWNNRRAVKLFSNFTNFITDIISTLCTKKWTWSSSTPISTNLIP